MSERDEFLVELRRMADEFDREVAAGWVAYHRQWYPRWVALLVLNLVVFGWNVYALITALGVGWLLAFCAVATLLSAGLVGFSVTQVRRHRRGLRR